MPSQPGSEKSNAVPIKLAKDLRISPKPPMRSPWLNDGPEMLRDSRC